MREFTTTNTGSQVIINTASFRDVLQLKEVLFKEIQKNPLGLKLMGKTENVLDRQIDFSEFLDFFKNTLIGCDTSEEIHNAIFNCLSKCTYKKVHRIDENLFDTVEEAREDYYEIIYACVEENLKPFTKSLASMWKTLAGKLGNSQTLSTILTNLK